MVKEIENNGKTFFICGACFVYYKDKMIAQKCEDFCNEYNACNTQLMKYAVIVNGRTCDIDCEGEKNGKGKKEDKGCDCC